MDISKSIDNVSSAIKNISDVINSIRDPYVVKKAIGEQLGEAHKCIIEAVTENTEFSYNEKLIFISNYQNMLKEYKRIKNVIDLASIEIKREHASKETAKSIDEDWINLFIDKVRLVSKETVQVIWGKLLVAECCDPGSISPALLHTFSIMTHEQAKFFCKMSQFCFSEIGTDIVHPLIFVSTNREAYADSNITPEKLKQLEHLGLIDCNFIDEYIVVGSRTFRLGVKAFSVRHKNGENEHIRVGNVVFTPEGRQLYDIIDSEFKIFREDIMGFTMSKFKARNCEVNLIHA